MNLVMAMIIGMGAGGAIVGAMLLRGESRAIKILRDDLAGQKMDYLSLADSMRYMQYNGGVGIPSGSTMPENVSWGDTQAVDPIDSLFLAV